ncbi:MAG: hypothetical protein J7578_20320 [Chitinophagaceae bacterium]|nr:hypothetical protein [Chitinophagaceae bacterium]
MERITIIIGGNNDCCNSADDPVITPPPFADESSKIVRFIASNKQISIISNLDVSTKLLIGKKTLQFRYVIIPGGTVANSLPIDWNNYGQVKAQLNLNN